METEQTEQPLDVLTENEKQSIDLFKSFVEDTLKFRSKGTASAAARARKNASALTKLLKVIRKELQESKNQKSEEKKSEAPIEG